MLRIEVPGEVTIAELVPILELPEIVCILLDRIICEMDVDISV